MPGPTHETGAVPSMPLEVSLALDRMEIRAYRALTRAARPLAPLILGYRERRGKEDPSRRGERLGKASVARPAGTVVWVHAASVGETSAVLPLMALLTERRPDLSLLLTTGTVTSARFALDRLPHRTVHQYVPLDSPALVAAFFDHWRPSLGIFTEQEVWPNLVIEAGQRSIPLALVNARMSDGSFARWQSRRGLAKALFSRFVVVLAQSDALAQKFMALGASRVVPAGNLKVDAPAPPVDAAAHAALEAALAGRPRLLGASTHAGEEVALAAAHRSLARDLPGLVTIIAPRHPERGAAIRAELAGLGFSVTQRGARGSLARLPDAATDIYIADTIGELGTLYASAPVAFIGGSLVKRGGQNPIEAVRHGTVVVTGPHTYNFPDVFGALIRDDGAVEVAVEAGLAHALGAVLSSPSRLSALRANAQQSLASLSGALERTTGALLLLLAGAKAGSPEDAREALKRAG